MHTRKCSTGISQIPACIDSKALCFVVYSNSVLFFLFAPILDNTILDVRFNWTASGFKDQFT
jgi:hypothetical protein